MGVSLLALSNEELDKRYPLAKKPPEPRGIGWLLWLKVGDIVEVRAGLNQPNGRVLGTFAVTKITPTRRFHVNGWIFNRFGTQYGAYGPGTAAIFPVPL